LTTGGSLFDYHCAKVYRIKWVTFILSYTGLPTVRKEAESPTFGKVLLLFFMDGDRVKCVMVYGRKLRASEIMSI